MSEREPLHYYETLPHGAARARFEAALRRVRDAGSLLETHTVTAEYSWEKSQDPRPLSRLGILAVQSVFTPAPGTFETRVLPPSVLQMTAWEGDVARVVEPSMQRMPPPKTSNLINRAIADIVMSERDWWRRAWEQMQTVEEGFIDFSVAQVISESPRPVDRAREYMVARLFNNGMRIQAKTQEVTVMHRGLAIGSSCSEYVHITAVNPHLHYARRFSGEVSMTSCPVSADAQRVKYEEMWMNEFGEAVEAAIDSGFALPSAD